jgi:nucleoside-diphosphate-sugar epimerase
VARDTIVGNLTDRDFVDEILKLHKPNCVIHLASQPSLPYSQLSWERALFTQLNNQMMNLNLLWGLKENNLSDTKYIITTTTGVPGQFYEIIPEEMVINRAGSWYHITRGFDSENCNLAARQWNLRIVEFRTAIVYGLLTEELREIGETSRFDTDFYFGTALNRFVAQAIRGEPLSVYGDGRQVKPFISLEDCVQSLANAIDFDFPRGHTILNQTTENVSIVHLAKLISQETGAEVKHIPNPRQEKEDFLMRFENKKFLKVLGHPKQLIGEGIKEIIGTLKDADSND